MKASAVIVEDEKLNAERLEMLIEKSEFDIDIRATLNSVEQATDFFNSQDVDLIFLDIELGDGTAFDLLEKIKTTGVIIFTTAYHQYAVKAFKFSAIDYLLKPLDKQELYKCLPKALEKVKENQTPIHEMLGEIQRYFKANYKKRFLVKSGENLSPISVSDIAYFYAEDGYSFIRTKTNQRHLVDFTLEELIEMIDPTQFFRVNRKVIAQIDSIANIAPYFQSRLVIQLDPSFADQLIISREKVKSFKAWLDG